MVKKYYIYKVAYASGILRESARGSQYIVSTKRLNLNSFVVVEHIDCGVFIGKVLENASKIFDTELLTYEKAIKKFDYIYIQSINLNKWLNKIKKEKRKKELEWKMKEKFEGIDNILKYQYYAEHDTEFKELYEEYKKISENEM